MNQDFYGGGYGGPMTRRQMRRQRRRRRHPLLRLIRLLVVLAVLFVVFEIAINPWIFRIGGAFTPTASWTGLGTVSASNGGRYVLSISFHGGFLGGDESGCSQFSGCDNMKGTARLCTLSGVTYTFPLTGQVHTWLNTNGARTSIDLTGGTPKPLPDGWVVALHGSWHGPRLVLASPDNSFTEVFTRRGAIRTVTSTADAGTARVTLAKGSSASFSRACAALSG
ncbi:MAG TPA: hypothetical protein VN840_09275 [Streptosporangiaceae bacterium]|nr:hypothetical protein [Streptosporangiaceae bacterium]